MRLPALALVLLWAGSAPAETQPTVSHQAGRLFLQALPRLLDHPEVEESLASGLTTTFVLEVNVRDGRGAKAVGSSLIEIRYELWDEVYLVRWIDMAREERRASLTSRDQLLEWWRKLELVVAEAAGLASADAWQVRVRLSVLPFSSLEQQDAQRWFTRSLETKGAQAGASDLQLAEVLNVVIATSIGRVTSLAFDWRLILAGGGSR